MYGADDCQQRLDAVESRAARAATYCEFEKEDDECALLVDLLRLRLRWEARRACDGPSSDDDETMSAER